MKRLKLTLAAFAASSSLALADPPPGPPPGMRGPPPIDRLASDLGLDENQKAQVKQIFDAQRAKMDAEREAMEADVRQQLTGVLNAEQLRKFDEMRQRRGPPPGQAGQPPAQ